MVHLQTYLGYLSENRLVFNFGSKGNLNVAVFDKYKRMFCNPQYQEQSGKISQTLASYFLYMYLKVIEGLSITSTFLLYFQLVSFIFKGERPLSENLLKFFKHL